MQRAMEISDSVKSMTLANDAKGVAVKFRDDPSGHAKHRVILEISLCGQYIDIVLPPSKAVSFLNRSARMIRKNMDAVGKDARS